MKYIISLIGCLLLSPTLIYSMEEKPEKATPVLKEHEEFPETSMCIKPAHILAADNIVTALERTYHGAKGLTPVKGLLEAHENTLSDTQAIVQMNDKERHDLATWYQTIFLHLSRMTPEEAVTHPLHTYKKLIYAAALKLYPSKQAAKQFLKCADSFTDEEKELNEFTSQAVKPGYRRDFYLKAKHSLTIQKNREKETKELQKTSDTLKKKTADTADQIANLTRQLAQLKELQTLNEQNQKKIDTEFQATNNIIQKTTTIYDEQMASLVQISQENANSIKKTEEIIKSLNKTATNLPHKKEAEQTELKAQTTLLASLKVEQAAIKRDIDLLTDEYTPWKKLLWKLSGVLTHYPVDDIVATPGNTAECSITEDLKDGTSTHEMLSKEL